MLGSFPRRIEPSFHHKVWGSPRIEPWFASRGDRKTAEVWFPAGDLLIKFLFTSEDLSIQVHPDDAYARQDGNPRGKTEMWHILRADPGARIAAGFRSAVRPADFLSAVQDGTIMDKMNWIEVSPGDTYLIPAGTVHSIGAGIALCEIQQNSDVTYRIYDYGRSRELHLRQASEVSACEEYHGKTTPCDVGGGVQLVAESPFFRTFRATVSSPMTAYGRYLIAIGGNGKVNGQRVTPGQVWEQAEQREWSLEPEGSASGPFNVLLTG